MFLRKSKRPEQLFFTGRVTLTKSILQTLSTYVMQSTMLPKFICNIIEKKKIHMVSRNLIYSPKSHDGLGLEKMSIINQSICGEIRLEAS
ncbi:putative ribonuclease H protein, partial [Mucuna pruriens]